MLQAPVLNSLSFDPFSFQQDGLVPPEIDIGWCEVAQALVVTAVIVTLDEGLDLSLEVARQIVVLQQDPILPSKATPPPARGNKHVVWPVR